MQALRSKVLHLAAIIMAAFLPLTIFVPSDTLYLFTGCILLTSTIAFIHAYWPALQISIKMTVNELGKVDILTLALFIVFSAVGFREGYIQLSREFWPVDIGYGRAPEYYIFLSFMQYCTTIAALLALSARNSRLGPAFMENVPGWPRGVFAVLAGLVVGSYFYLN